MTNIITVDEVKELQSLPTNVHSKQDLALLPDKYLSDDPQRPLYLHPYKYALKPLYYSVLFILIIEGLERLTYYGINTIETAFLLGVYDQAWHANLTTVQAASYTSASVGIAYTAPFLGGILADGFLGEYWCIILGVAAFYIPGIFLIALTTFPGLVRYGGWFHEFSSYGILVSI
jgi:proton-dependent oligopeptide transporter, POT family